jgi:hypothetical protein
MANLFLLVVGRVDKTPNATIRSSSDKKSGHFEFSVSSKFANPREKKLLRNKFWKTPFYL